MNAWDFIEKKESHVAGSIITTSYRRTAFFPSLFHIAEYAEYLKNRKRAEPFTIDDKKIIIMLLLSLTNTHSENDNVF